MPEITVNGTRLHYIDSGTEGNDTIVFSHGFLFNHQMFEAQIAHFQDDFRCVAYDHRGQGQSEVPRSGYDIDSITDDTIALIEQLDLAPCHFVGLSMGGFVGLRLALRKTRLLKSLVLIASSADAEPPENLRKYKLLSIIARLFGTRPVVGRIMGIMFGKTFLNDPLRKHDQYRWRQHFGSLNVTGVLRAVEAATGRDSVYEVLDTIDVPTLILVGDEDVTLPIEKSQRMHQRISGSELRIIQKAGHSATIEAPDAVIQALEDFWQRFEQSLDHMTRQ